MYKIEKSKMVKGALAYLSLNVDKHTMSRLVKSALFMNDNYLCEACILLRMGTINLDDFLALIDVKEDELSLYLMDDADTGYLNPTLEDLYQAYLGFDEVEATYDKLKEKQIREKLARLKALTSDNLKKKSSK